MRAFLFALLIPLTLIAAEDQQSPIYRVTVVQRSLPAVNYGHRAAPTKIDFRGTVLEPNAKGEATVEAKGGAVAIQSKFMGLGAPSRFGSQYLTYVLWAISPEGEAERLGELITNTHDEAKLDVSTSLQTFGLLVTAEPYFAVSKPSPVVVVENVLRPDTIGSSEPVSAKYDLLPRADTYTVNLDPATPSNEKAHLVSQQEYEVISAIYQAQNAIQIAKSEHADTYASDTLSRAEQLLQQAEQFRDRKANHERIIALARQATQTAQDARSIAAHKKSSPSE